LVDEVLISYLLPSLGIVSTEPGVDDSVAMVGIIFVATRDHD
jgi:hypothetical protein